MTANCESNSNLSGWKKIVSKIGIGCAIAVPVLALIFLFTVGLSTSFTSNGQSDVENFDGGLFYYFKEFSDLIKTLSNSNNPSPSAIFTLINDLFGIIATLALIIVTVILGIIALVKSIKAIAKGEDNDYLKSAIATFASFFVFSIAFASIEAIYSTTDSSVTCYGTLNSAGVTGIILSGIFLLGSIGCKIAVDFKSYVNTKTILGIVGTVVKVVCVILITCFITYAITITTSSYTQSGSAFAFVAANASKLQYNEKLAGPVGLSMVTSYFYIAFIIIMLASVRNAIKELCTVHTQVSLKMPIVTLIFAFIYMLLSIVTASSFNSVLKATGYGVTYPIVVFVLALVNLAGAIVRNAGAKKNA